MKVLIYSTAISLVSVTCLVVIQVLTAEYSIKNINALDFMELGSMRNNIQNKIGYQSN